MKNAWNTLLKRIDARTERERVLLLVAGLAICLLLAGALFIEPAWRAQRADQARQLETRARLSALEQREATLRAELARDPDAGTKARIATLQGEVGRADAWLNEALARFITPAQMNRVLRELVGRTGGLRLDGLRSLTAEKAGPPPETADGSAEHAGPPPVQIWKRGVELRLRGSYNALLAYLDAVENLPWQLEWDLLTVNGEQYPESEFILRLHTLSLEEDWIGV